MSCLLIPLSACLLRILGFRTSKRLLMLRDRSPQFLNGDLELRNDIEAGFWLALKYSPLCGTCLSQSMALMRLLQDRNFQTTLRVGVRSSTGGFVAHAWLESAGAIMRVGSKPKQQFTELEGFNETVAQNG